MSIGGPPPGLSGPGRGIGLIAGPQPPIGPPDIRM